MQKSSCPIRLIYHLFDWKLYASFPQEGAERGKPYIMEQVQPLRKSLIALLELLKEEEDGMNEGEEIIGILLGKNHEEKNSRRDARKPGE